MTVFLRSRDEQNGMYRFGFASSNPFMQLAAVAAYKPQTGKRLATAPMLNVLS